MRVQNSVGLDGLQGLGEGLVAVEGIPRPGVSMPLDVEAVVTDPVEADEGDISHATFATMGMSPASAKRPPTVVSSSEDAASFGRDKQGDGRGVETVE